MAEPRMNLLKAIDECLYQALDHEEAEEMSRKITIILNDYEVTKRCTDVTVLDDGNEKIIKLYRACLLVDGKSDNTIYQYTRAIRKLADFLGKPFLNMGVYDIRFYLASEKQRGVSDRSLENARSFLSAFFTWMTAEEMLQKNPMANIKPIDYKDEIRKPFSDVELDKLRSACQTAKERALLEMLLATGVRVSELSLMDIGDIDTKNLEVKVVHGKGNQERTTFIITVAVSRLQEYLAERDDEGVWVFENKDHERLKPEGIRFILNELAKRANVSDVHPHRFRRTFASKLAKRGMDIREIQIIMDHKNIGTTQIYVYSDKEDIKSSYKKYSS